MGQQEGRPPYCVLTREINCGEEEEKTDGEEGVEVEMKRETGSWHPVMRAKRKELKKTLEENRQHGERRRKLNKKEDGGVKVKGSQKN